MLSLFVQHIAITFLCFSAGFLFYKLLNKISNIPVIFFFITGLICITAVVQIVCLFIPVNKYVGVFIIFALSIGVWFNKADFFLLLQSTYKSFLSFKWHSFLLFFSLWLLILLLNAGPVIMDDTGSYHIQMIKWVEEYGTVPGIANLHERYGFNSSWFASIAAFNFFPHKMYSYSALNGLLSVWFCFYFTKKVFAEDATPSIKTASIFTIIISLICWPILRGNAASANYDSITMLVIVVLLTELIEKNIQKSRTIFSIEWVLWPVYLFTVRIINFPLLILILIPLTEIIRRKDWKNTSTITIIIITLTIPFLGRNVILSGYPFYPSPAFNFFAVDWKTPKEVLDKLLYFITYYNRVNNGFIDIEETAQFGNIRWIKPWFQYMFGYDKLIFLPGITGIILFLIILLRGAKAGSLKFLITGITIIIALTSWFLIAPDPRFIYGFLITGNFFLFTVIFKKGTGHFFLYGLTVVLLSGGVLFSIFKLRDNSYRNFVFIKPLPQPELKKTTINGIELYMPEKVEGNWNERCYETNLPCLYSIYQGLEPRGVDIKDGFRIKKQN